MDRREWKIIGIDANVRETCAHGLAEAMAKAVELVRVYMEVTSFSYEWVIRGDHLTLYHRPKGFHPECHPMAKVWPAYERTM